MAVLDNRCRCCFSVKENPGACPHCGCDETTRNAQHQLPIGTVLKEQYQIGRVLGQGGFGITYLGWDLYLDIPVAIKEYYPGGTVMRDCAVTLSVTDVSGDDGLRFHNNRDRFMREAKMLARFSQVREVVQVKNFFLSNNTAYIVMEYVDGITLKQHVVNQGGKLTVAETLKILKPVIQTMSKIHRTGIVHRDLSPDNIMMLPDGGAKVLDFGAVRSVDSSQVGKELTKSTEAILKQGYAPIEQYQKKGALGPWTDVYALCATMYYCLTGEVPPDAPARMLGYEELDMAATGLNPHQQEALLHGMAFRVEDRLHSMEELYAALFGKQGDTCEEPRVPELEETPVAADKPKKTQDSGMQMTAVTGSEFNIEVAQNHRIHSGREKKTPVPVKAEPLQRKQSGSGKRPVNQKRAGIWIGLVLASVAVILGFVLFPRRAEEIPEQTTAPTAAQREIVHSFLIPGYNLYWTLYDDGALVFTGTGQIPDDCGEWNDYKSQIRSVVLDGEIIAIGGNAFADCENLQMVDFGSHLERIGYDAFRNTSLSELVIPDTVERIDDRAFRGTELCSVVIPDSVAFLGNGAFSGCEELTDVSIGPNTRLCYDAVNDAAAEPIFCGSEGVIREDFILRGPSGGIVEDYALRYGYTFESNGKTEPEGRGVVNDDITWWFDQETGFLKLDGEGYLGFYGGSFVYYGSLSYANEIVVPWDRFRQEVVTVSIGDAVKGSVPANMFENHRNLDDVFFGENITDIGDYAFARTGIDWLHMPDTILNIQPYAFDHCEKLRHVSVSLGVWGLDGRTFNQCVNLEEFFFSGWMRDEYLHTDTPFTSREKNETTMPSDLVIYCAGKHCGAAEFAGNLGIPTLQGVDGRKDGIFGNAGGRVYWSLKDGTLRLFGYGDTGFFRSDASMTTAWHDNVYQNWSREDSEFYPYRNEIQHIIVEPGVTRLNKAIFADMPNLQSVDFGNVEALYSEAFVNCGVENLELPESIHTICDRAVVDCIRLHQVKIYNAQNGLGNRVFENCSALRWVYIYSNAQPARNFLQGTQDVTIHTQIGSPTARFCLENDIPFTNIMIVG